jgi:hypothetical protein
MDIEEVVKGLREQLPWLKSRGYDAVALILSQGADYLSTQASQITLLTASLAVCQRNEADLRGEIERLNRKLAEMPQGPKARQFAAIMHEGQTYGPGEPYTSHLDAVVALVGGNDAAQSVAYLHDVLEDTEATFQEVEKLFGGFIADCVALVTDEAGANRKSRKAATHAKLSKVGPAHYLALIVKTADRTANVEACVRKGNVGLLKMYRQEQEAFKAAVYRPGLCNHLWGRIEAALAKTEDAATLRAERLEKALELRDKIAVQTYKAIDQVAPGNVELLCILGSIGDSLGDDEVLECLEQFNEHGTCKAEVLFDVSDTPTDRRERFRLVAKEALAAEKGEG